MYINKAEHNDLSSKGCFTNKTEDLNPSVFNMITWKVEPNKAYILWT